MLAPPMNGDSRCSGSLVERKRRLGKTAHISATADDRGFPPQFVAHRPGSISTQFVADHDALNGIGHDGAEGASAHSHCYDTVARRHALDGTVKLVGARRALKARSTQAQRTSCQGQCSHGQHEAAGRIGTGTDAFAHRPG